MFTQDSEPIAIPVDGTPESDARIRILALKHGHMPGQPSLDLHSSCSDDDGDSVVFMYDGSANSGLQARVLAEIMDLNRCLLAAPVMMRLRDAGEV